ncbi:MAG: YHS domain-containing protein [Sandaracinaceae bacterium]|nr:YHS domain-containing protein [Sandaracinaceae bacterium]MDW8246924.1 YHS domain-containing protein [Sandaracinaceae bacterium]
MKRIALFGLVFGLITLEGCGGSSTPSEQSLSHASSGGESSNIVPPGEAKIGDTTRCPVSGETFVVTENSPKVEHDGRTYYFCCPHCAERFRQNPHQFLSPEHEKSGPASSSS